jgi:hypothetical protein
VSSRIDCFLVSKEERDAKHSSVIMIMMIPLLSFFVHLIYTGKTYMRVNCLTMRRKRLSSGTRSSPTTGMEGPSGACKNGIPCGISRVVKIPSPGCDLMDDGAMKMEHSGGKLRSTR